MTSKEFEEMVENTIDRRLNVWLTQLTDAFIGLQDEDDLELKSELAASLKLSLE